MPTVLHISCHPNVDRRFIYEMNYLVQQGWEVGFLCTPMSLDGTGLSPEVHLFSRLQGMSGKERGLFAAVCNRFFKMLHACGYRLLVFLPFWGYQLFAVACTFLTASKIRTLELYRRQSDLQPDIIHVHDVWLLEYAKKLRRRYYPQAKIIYDCHEFTPFQTPYRNEQKAVKAIEQRGLAEVDGVIAVNESIARRMEELYGICRPVVIYNSCAPGKQSAKLSKSAFCAHFGIDQLQDDAVVILFQGSFSAGKNLEALVKAFALLPENLHLFLLGNGEFKAKLQKICQAEKLSNVHFGNAVALVMLSAYTACADLGVIPYLAAECENNRLCTPNKLFEYIDAGIPIAANDLPELRACINRFDNGVCCPMESEKQIADSLMTMVTRLKRGEFSQASMTHARDYYAFDRQMQKLTALYDQVMRQPFCSHLRILHLPFNVASKMSITVQALKKRGENVKGLCFVRKNLFSSKKGLLTLAMPLSWRCPFRSLYFAVLGALRITYEIWRAELVHYYAYPAFSFGLDLLFCRLLRKAGVVEFCGSDIRIPEIAMHDNPYLKEMYENNPAILKIESKKRSLRNQRRFSRCGFLGLSNVDILNCFSPKYFPHIEPSAVRISTADYIPLYPDDRKKRPLVIHMPSDFNFKGTRYVLTVIEALKKKYDFDFQLVHHCAHEVALEKLRTCDIFLDQFILGAYGMASVEAMAMGKVVVCYLGPRCMEYYPPEIPIVNASCDSLGAVLGKLLADGEKRAELGRASRLYVEKYHDSAKMAERLSKKYASLWQKKHIK